MRNLAVLLARDQPVLLDGAVGTELLRRGVRTELPLWSARALLDPGGVDTLTEIHFDYAHAGAEILITNTFRTTLHTLKRAGLDSQWRVLNQRAVHAARKAATAAPGLCLVAGSIAPLEDCYRPDLAPPHDVCLREHSRQVALLSELGVDLIIIETMNCLREASAALEAACESGLDVVLSLCPRPPAHLLSGEPLAEVVPQLLAVGGDRLRGLLLNCAPPEVIKHIYPSFAMLVRGLPHGLYVHLGRPEATVGWEFSQKYEPAVLASWVERRLAEGARLVGGCCGTTPAHIAALRRVIDQSC